MHVATTTCLDEPPDDLAVGPVDFLAPTQVPDQRPARGDVEPQDAELRGDVDDLYVYLLGRRWIEPSRHRRRQDQGKDARRLDECMHACMHAGHGWLARLLTRYSTYANVLAELSDTLLSMSR